MYSYHVTGLISALLSTIASAGLATQAKLLWQRRRLGSIDGQSTTAVLSINRFVTSYVIFLAMYTYGAMLSPFNHYLVWPRVLGLALSLSILYQIKVDRQNTLSRMAFNGCTLLLLVANSVIWWARPIENPDPIVFPLIVVVVGLIYLQGGMIQINLIRKSRSTGSLSRQMHVLFVCKDISLILFALVMGAKVGWPILLMCAVGLTVNLSTLWCFRWANEYQQRAVAVSEL